MWYRKYVCAKNEDGRGEWGVLDTQLLCCQYEKNRREKPNEHKRNDTPNYPPENDFPTDASRRRARNKAPKNKPYPMMEQPLPR